MNSIEEQLKNWYEDKTLQIGKFWVAFDEDRNLTLIPVGEAANFPGQLIGLVQELESVFSHDAFQTVEEFVSDY